MNKAYLYFSLIICALQLACQPGKKQQQEDENWTSVPLSYAQEFTLDKNMDGYRLSILPKDHKGETNVFHLVNDVNKRQVENTIPVPCKKIICLSSTQLSYFLALDDIDDIVAINSSRYLRHKGMKKRVEDGLTKKIGKEGSFNIETIAALDPDVIFVSPFKVGGYDALRSLGIPLVPMAAYSEQTPLGRAEWMKMMALFVGQEEKANELFTGIETRYTQLKEKATQVAERPTVFSGKMRTGNWYVPGGNSFYAHYFRDAGADYIIKDNKQESTPLDFETVYNKASECDFWRIVHPEKEGMTLQDLAMQDNRYMDFKAFKKKQVLLCNIRQKPYYEQAAVKPDVLLADYIHFFHPELLPGYQPVFYELLK